MKKLAKIESLYRLLYLSGVENSDLERFAEFSGVLTELKAVKSRGNYVLKYDGRISTKEAHTKDKLTYSCSARFDSRGRFIKGSIKVLNGYLRTVTSVGVSATPFNGYERYAKAVYSTLVGGEKICY